MFTKPDIFVNPVRDPYKALLLLLLLLLKQIGSARLRENDIQLINPKTAAPQYQPIDRKQRNGKIVEDYSKEIEQLRPTKKHWPCS